MNTSQPLSPSDLLAAWTMRLLLGFLLLLGGEILLWQDPQLRPLSDWALLIPGYVLLAALLLDLMARYRVRDVYDVMLLAAIYGLLNGVLLNPQIALEDFPRTLATRALGGYTFLGFEMIGLFLAFLGGSVVSYRRLLIGGAVTIGFAWGIWVRWSPVLSERMTEAVMLPTMFAYVVGVLLVILLVYALVLRTWRETDPLTLRFSPVGALIIAALLLVLFMVQAAQEALNPAALLPAAALIIFCWAILWFRRADKGATILGQHLPPTLLSPLWMLATFITFAFMTALVFERPLVQIGRIDQLLFIEWVFAGLGFGWLPFVAAVISVRAVDRQYRRLNV